MTNKTDICNLALLKIGKARLSNVDTDSSEQANVLRQVYNSCLKQILNENYWSFATFRAILPRSSEAPAFGYSYKYILPTNPEFIRLISIEDSPEYSIENDGLHSNNATIKIKYVGFQNEVNKYLPSFITAFSTLLASELCFTMNGDKTLASDLYKKYRDVELLIATNQDRSNQKLSAIERSSWISSRFGNENVNITINNA